MTAPPSGMCSWPTTVKRSPCTRQASRTRAITVPYTGSTVIKTSVRGFAALAGRAFLRSAAKLGTSDAHRETSLQRVSVQVTSIGHAGFRIDTAAGSILCDPWVNPAYFASWFPFPDNSQLDWEHLGDCDYLYVSHLHRDHFDAEHLKRFVSKRATVLLPEYPTSELRDQLEELGFTRFLETKTNEVVELDGGLKVMVQALTSPTDGPIGDSSLWVEYDGVRMLNQNDARPTDLTTFAELGHVHAHLLQFSGAIWYPMVYELPQAAKTAFGKQKRERQFDRTFRYIDDLKASWVFPIEIGRESCRERV